MAVCVLPGAELAFANDVAYQSARFLRWDVQSVTHRTAIFRQINKDKTVAHHDALEFPDGQIVSLTRLCEGQQATVLQLPAQPTSASESDVQKRIAYVG